MLKLKPFIASLGKSFSHVRIFYYRQSYFTEVSFLVQSIRSFFSKLQLTIKTHEKRNYTEVVNLLTTLHVTVVTKLYTYLQRTKFEFSHYSIITVTVFVVMTGPH